MSETCFSMWPIHDLITFIILSISIFLALVLFYWQAEKVLAKAHVYTKEQTKQKKKANEKRDVISWKHQLKEIERFDEFMYIFTEYLKLRIGLLLVALLMASLYLVYCLSYEVNDFTYDPTINILKYGSILSALGAWWVLFILMFVRSVGDGKSSTVNKKKLMDKDGYYEFIADSKQ